MGSSIEQSIQEIAAAKLAIKGCIERKGVSLTNTPFTQYAAKIDAISGVEESTVGIVQIFFLTTAGENTLHLYEGSKMFHCHIDWGDEITNGRPSTVCPPNGGRIKHNYAAARYYTITIVGTKFGGFYLGDATEDECMKYQGINVILELGGFQVTERTDFTDCFAGCKSLSVASVHLFHNCANAIDFTRCFWGCYALNSIPATLFFACQKATTFTQCFDGCMSLREIPNGLFDRCTEATTFTGCFQGCSDSLQEIPNGLFDRCPNARFFAECFAACSQVSNAVPTLWQRHFYVEGDRCFAHCTRASNYNEIPENWK